MTVWLVMTGFFLFFWMMGLLTELQRSETIDLQKLMHLPVALGQMFVVNYLVSHFALSLVLIVPLMLGLCVGSAISRGPEMLLLLPLALSMILMITAWTYCLRGWLATMMTNPRRRRTVIMCISLAFVLIAQGPNLYFNVFQHRNFPGGQTVTGEERNRQNQERVASTEKMFNNLIAAQSSFRRCGCRSARGRWPGEIRCPRCSARSAAPASRRWACGARIAARCGFITATPAARRR